MITPTVALTFDDGPSEWTEPLLDALAARDARATFFVLGCNIAGHEDTIRRMVADGHEVGVHGWDHQRADELEPDELRSRIERVVATIADATGAVPRWWRPPWNRANEETAQAIESIGLSWVRPTLDSYDTVRQEEKILEHLLADLRDGAIVGLHDGIAANGQQWFPHREHTVAAVGRLLVHCRSVTVSELLGAKVA